MRSGAAEAVSNPIYRIKPTFLSQKWDPDGLVFAQRDGEILAANSANLTN
jgi:hypothetical protein